MSDKRCLPVAMRLPATTATGGRFRIDVLESLGVIKV
jgi:hypothetical protein